MSGRFESEDRAFGTKVELQKKAVQIIDTCAKLERALVKGSEANEDIMKAAKLLAQQESRIISTSEMLRQIQRVLVDLHDQTDNNAYSFKIVASACELLTKDVTS